MSYNPYPQQPQIYDPYQQQYPPAYQQPYQAPGTVTMIPYQPPPPRKTWTPLRLVLLVIGVVAMLIIAFFLCAIFFIWATPFESGPGTTTPTISMAPTAFENPSSNMTTNGGGWSARVISVQGTSPLLSSLSVRITSSGSTVQTLTAVSGSKSDLSYTAGPMNWYLLKGGGSLKFVDGSTLKNLDSVTSKDLTASGFETVQGAALIFIDTDASGRLTAGDVVFVYSDIDGGGTSEIPSGDMLELFLGDTSLGGVSLT